MGGIPIVDHHLIDAARLAVDWSGAAPPFACIDLSVAPQVAAPVRLPPFPVIGLGDASHPLAAALDAVIEAPVTIGRIAGQVAGQPLAAAALVQLLRATESAPVAHALTLESMCYAMLQGSTGHRSWIAARPGPSLVAPGRIDTVRDRDVLHVTIDRPSARNAIDRAMRDALFQAFTIAALDEEIVRVELRAVGRAFGVGADLAEFGTTRDPATAHAIRAATLPAHPLSRCAAKVAVHVRGACIGASLELAAFAGRVTAARDAWFQLPELAMGIIPGAGGCVSVPRRIGRRRTALMILSGARIDAATALRWGLVDAVMDEPPVDPRRRHAD